MRMISFVVAVGFLSYAAMGSAEEKGRALQEGTCEWKRFLRSAWEKNREDIMQLAICDAQVKIGAAKIEIAKEYAIAKESGGGVVDKSSIYDEQMVIRRYLERIQALRAKLGISKTKPLKCTHQSMRTILKCSADYDAKICGNEPWISLRYTFDEYISALDGDMKYDYCDSEPPPFSE